MTGMLPDNVIVYGAGGFGRRMILALQEMGVTVTEIADAAPQVDVFAGIPVRPFAEVDVSNQHVVIGISNPHVAIAALADELNSRGAARVIGPVEASMGLWSHAIKLDNYWMTGDVSLYEREWLAIEGARKLLSDDASVTTFDAVLHYRRSGKPEHCPEGIGLEHQYFPDDIDFITQSMRFVDGGAFDGDTVRQLRVRECDVEALLAFEPDPANFARLVATIGANRSLESVAVPVGLAASLDLVSFEADGTSGAAANDRGLARVLCVSLDAISGAWSPTHIKLDIEGAEFSAIEGMRSILHRNRPRLAVSAYHDPRDHWRLLLQLGKATHRYRFYMRTYGERTFDTVIYGIPDDL